MPRTYTRKEMAYLLGCSVPTIDNDIQHLKLEPVIGNRGMKLYSERDINLISQLREHCGDKSNSRESFVPNTEVEIVENEPKVSRLVTREPAITKYQQSIEFGLSQDPLSSLRSLRLKLYGAQSEALPVVEDDDLSHSALRLKVN